MVALRSALACAKRMSSSVDDGGVGKADGNVISRRSELLEVARLIDLEEGLVILAAIQGIGLDPFLAAGDPVSCWRRYDAVPSGWHVGNDGLTSEWRQSCAV